MQLLVSVASAAEAVAALDGGADLIDAKDPRSGALGAVSVDTLRSIRGVVGTARPVTAALGEGDDPAGIARAVEAFAAHTAFVKIGFGLVRDDREASSMAAAAVGAAACAGSGCGVVLVAYADAPSPFAFESLSPAWLDMAAGAGAAGVLLDTAHKDGPALPDLVEARTLARWIDWAHARGLFVAAAGKVTAGDFPWIAACGADIVGVRGAACDAGRTGKISIERVRALARVLHKEPS